MRPQVCCFVSDAGGGGRHAGRLRVRRGSRARADARAVRVAARDAAPRRAGGAAAARAGVRRLAADPAAADDTVRRRDRRLLRRRPRAHAGAVGAGRRRACSAPRWRSGRRSRPGRLWPIAAAAGLYVVVSIGGSAYAAIIQRFVVAPNEQVRETPFIVHNIQATRAAFGLDGVAERPLSGEAQPDARRPRAQRRDDRQRAAVERPAAARHLQPDPGDPHLLRLRRRRQRPLHDQRQVPADHAVGARAELASLPSRTWINEHLTFTHGYGLTLGPVNEVTPEGLPVLFIKDLPPVSTVDLKVTQPAIYYGELPNDHVFVKTKTEEFDYPRGDDNVFATYNGRRRRAALERLPAADVRDPLPLDRHVLLAEPDRGEPRDDVPADRGARRADRAVPHLRSRSVPDDLRRPAGLDAGRLHDVARAIRTRRPSAA